MKRYRMSHQQAVAYGFARALLLFPSDTGQRNARATYVRLSSPAVGSKHRHAARTSRRAVRRLLALAGWEK